MKRIEMFSSSADLRAGLHRVLSSTVLDPSWNERRPWWDGLPDEASARAGALGLEELADAILDRLPCIDRARSALSIGPLDADAVRSALRRSIISGRAHRAHGGRDVYGASNKDVWDLLVAPLAAALESRWGASAVADGVVDLDDARPAPALRELAETLVGFRTGPKDTDHRACADWLTERLSGLGFEVDEHRRPGFPPVLEAHRPARGQRGHVMLYGHYDTIQAGRRWVTDPDCIHEQSGRWIARGIADDKGPLAARLWAIGSTSGGPALTWFIQGEEETGSIFSREVLAERVPALPADLYLDETGYHDHADGTLRLLARRVGMEVDDIMEGWLAGLRVVAARHGLGTRFEARGLNKAVVAGGCPFDQALPRGARVLALGVNDTAAGIHASNESLPTRYLSLHREQLALLFHAVGRMESS